LLPAGLQLAQNAKFLCKLRMGLHCPPGITGIAGVPLLLLEFRNASPPPLNLLVNLVAFKAAHQSSSLAVAIISFNRAIAC